MTGFKSFKFDNSTCEKVMDLEQVNCLRLGVNDGSGNSRGSFGIEVWRSGVDEYDNSRIWREISDLKR